MHRMPILVRPKPFLSRRCLPKIYAGLARLSPGCPPDGGRLHTCYSPVRRSPARSASTPPAAPRLACVKPAASVHPEPGSNSPLLVMIVSYLFLVCLFCSPTRLLFSDLACLRFLRLIYLVVLTETFFFRSLAYKSKALLLCPVALCQCSLSLLREPLFPFCECKVRAKIPPAQVFLQQFCRKIVQT